MTFTRLSDAATLTPITVFGPFEAARTPRNIARELLHSSEVRTTFVPTGHRTGEYQCLFHTHAEALAAADWFSVASLFTFLGPTEGGGGGLIVTDDGYIIEAPAGGVVDTSFNTRFLVWGGELSITQNPPMWELRVPYKEVPAP